MQEGAAGSIVQLGLGLDLSRFLDNINIAENELLELAKRGKTLPPVALRASLDFSQLEAELKLARKLIASTSAEIKVGTSFYKGGSNFAVSKTALLRDVLRPLQDNIKDDRKYQVKLGAYISGDVDIDTAVASTQKKLDKKQVSIKVKAIVDNDIKAQLDNTSKVVAESARRVPAAAVAKAAAAPTGKADTAAARQALMGLTKTPSEGGLDSRALRGLQQVASGAGIDVVAKGATELRKKLSSAFESAGEDAILGLALGLANGTSQIKGAADAVGEALIKALKQCLGIASPSKEGKKLGQWTADGLGQGLITGIVGWERKMAGAIRQAVGNAVQQGMVRDSAARGALAEYGKEAGSTIATSLSKALKQGLAASVAPALKGGLLGATGGGVTGGLMGGLGAAGAAIKQAAMPSLLTFGSSNLPEKAGMLGHGAASLASGGANEALNTFLQHSVESVLNAALGSGGQGALLGAAGVAGVAGLAGMAKGASGSLVTQAVETIKNRILGTAAKQAQAQAQLPGSTGGALAAPVENAGNVAGVLQQTLGNVSKGLLAFVKELTPGKLKERIFDIAWRIDQAAEQFAIVKKDMQVLSMKIKEVRGGFSGNIPQRLLPPQPVAGTGLIREDNKQLGRITGRGSLDFGGKSFGTTRAALQSTGSNEWKIVEEANGIWQRIKTNAELAEEFQAQITKALSSTAKSMTRGAVFPNGYRKKGDNNDIVDGGTINTYTGNAAPGMFNPFDEAFYRSARTSNRYDKIAGSGMGRQTLGGTFGGSSRDVKNPNDLNGPNIPVTPFRRATQERPGALALRPVPVEVYKSFKEANALIAETQRRMQEVAKTFDTLKAKSQIQVDQNIRELNLSLNATKKAFVAGEIAVSDMVAAFYGFKREKAGLESQTAEVQNLAQAFRDLGIESNAALASVNNQRNVSLSQIQRNPNLSESEKTRASNARDIQQASFVNDQVRVAQGASGFGGFRGREIGNKTLTDRQQRSELANAIRQLKEYGDQITKTSYNQETYNDIVKATAVEVQNAERALRVLNNTANDGEKITLAARNAWGTILDDFQNLLPQLLVFAVAYNLILQRVMSTPGAVIQAAASFDRLNTSIDSYLSATRGIGDSSGELEKIKSIALDLGVGYEKAAKSYLNFAAATQGTSLQGKEADISRTLTTAGRNQGLSGEQLDRAATALTQILSKGRVQAEELRGQLAEQLPGAVQVAARAYGVTTKELYRMVEAGQLASDEFVDKFMKQLVDEGADVNQLGDSFSNVSEQLGSTLQMLAASAGEPFLQPLTVAMQGLNMVMTAMIPLATPLLALFAAIGSNALKGALGIKGWQQGISQVIDIADGGGETVSSILDANGNPVKTKSSGKLKSGLSTAKSGFGEIMGAGKGIFTGEASQAISRASAGVKGLTTGLKEAALAGRALGTSLLTALTPALKMFLVIEGISLAIKAFKGEISTLGDEFRKSRRNIENLNVTQAADSDKENALQQAGATAMKGFNPVNPIKGALGEIGKTWTMLDAANISNDSAEMIKAINKNKKVFAKAAEEMLEVDKKLYDERLKSNQDYTDDQRIKTLERIKLLEKEKKAIIESLPGKVTSSKVRTQISLNESSKQALEKQIEERGGIGQATLLEKLQIKDIEQLNNLLKEQLKLLTKIDDRKTIAGAQSKLKGYQDNVALGDINSTNFVAWQKKAAGLQKAINDTQLLPEEQQLMALETAQKAITAQLQVQELIGKIRLGRLENERKLIQSNLDLEKTRTRLAESIANRKLVIANAVDDPTSARAAQAEIRAIQDRGQKKEVAGQYQLIENESAKFKLESALQKEQLSVQKQQLNIDLQMLEIEQLKMRSARESGEVNLSLLSTYLKMEESLRGTIAAVKKQQGYQVNLNGLVDEEAATRRKVTANAVENVRLGDQAYQEGSRTAEQKERIEKAIEQINASERVHLGYIKDINDRLKGRSELNQSEVDLAKQKIQAQQEELQLSQEIANVEIAAIDKLLEFQNGSATGGFFEKMAKYSIAGNQSEQDAYSLANQRMSLVEKMQKEQNQQKILDMNMKKAEIEAEQQMLTLKAAQLKLDNESAKVTLRAANEKLELAYRAQDDIQGAAAARQVGASLGANTASALPNELDNRLADQQNLASYYKYVDTVIEKILNNGVEALGVSANLFNNWTAGQEKLMAAQDKLNSVDNSIWFAKFIDESTSLGRVLSSASQGIAEYRQSISAALTEGLMGGDNGEAIVNAGKQFGSKLMTSFIDEMVMKPMEKNFFAGIGKLFGMKEPQSEQKQIAASTASQVQISERTETKIGTLDSSIVTIGGKIDAGVQEIVGAILKRGMYPSELAAGAAPAAAAAQAAGVAQALTTTVQGAIGNMLPNTKGGPNINRGVGNGHNGRDLGLDLGDSIHARMNGTVMDSYNSGFGKVGGAVVVKYENGSTGTYGHTTPSVNKGDKVSAGQQIGFVTADGQNTHLHYELRDALGKIIDPINEIKASLAAKPGVIKAPAAQVAAALPPAQILAAAPMPATATSTALALPQTPATQLASMPYDKGFSNMGTGIDWSTMNTNFDYMATAMAGTTAGLDLWTTDLKDTGTITEGFKSAANDTSTGLTKFSETIAGVSQVIGGIGMAMSGINQTKKGGLSNTLGGIGSILLGIGSGISGIMGIGKAFGIGGGASKGVGIPEARANGGPINAYNPYIVGEKGPELIFPGRSGTVASSDKLREAMAGGGSSYGGGMSLNMSFQTSKFGGEEYVSKSQLEQAMYETRRASVRDGARQGEARTLSRIQQDPRTRRRIGI